MAVESVGLAASVAGLLSLGLQITGGIVKYMDAFKGRDEELRNVKKQNDNLAVSLCAMKTVLAGLQGQSPAVAAAVDQNIRSCEEDLRALEALSIQLSDHAGNNWTKRLENKKKKATFAFHRPKLRDLELQIQRAHGTLQLIQGSLGLSETANRNAGLLTAIESSSRDHASEMLLIRSEVAALATPVADICGNVPGLQNSLDRTTQLVVAHSGAMEIEIHKSSQRVRNDLQHSHDSIVEHLKTIDHKVQLLGEDNSSLRALALRAASKPAALKSLCDDMKLLGKRCNLGNASQLSKSHRAKRTSSDPSRNLRLGLGVGKQCICPHPERSVMQMQMQRGYTYLSGEWESQGHWSSCPLSIMPRKQRLKAGVKYTGVSRLLKSVIEISFVFTSGAGGCSISPSFTYYPTVDVNSDPAFRLINVMRRSSFYSYGSSRELFYIACLRKLAKLLEERRTYPTVVDDQNMTLMHYAVASVKSLVRSNITYSRRSSKEMKTLAEIVPILLSYEWAEDAVLALSRANFENQPAMSKRTSKISKFTDFSIAVHRSLMSFGKLPEVVTAFECGPLSMAIVNNDSDEVDRILKRFPDSIAELDLYGRSPLHLAAAKPEILKRLVKAADLITLNQRDSTGTNALETAMVLSSLYCINGTEYVRCRECSCYLCVKYLLDASFNLIRTLAVQEWENYSSGLCQILENSSELARRHYVFHMRKTRSLLRSGHLPTNKSLSTKQEVGNNGTTSDTQRSILHFQRQLQIYDEAGGALDSLSNWIFQQTRSVHLAQLFYRHGFRPSPSIFLQLRYSNPFGLRDFLSPEIVCWLQEHGGDILLRSPAGYTNKTADDRLSCGPELTILTYAESIRFMTFEALDLFHSCCNTHSMVEEDTAWIGMDDVEIVENQGFLLELHEKLVAEFTQKAGAYLGDEPNMGKLFPQFWTSYWADRMTQELEVLHGEELTESERRDAEEIGVVWHQAIESDKSEDGNPYRNEDLEHYFFELDLICPEYNEPWPEELRRIR
ncbi:Ankyrin repeat-containing domain protein [Colletotrichum scovillei]|nr:Ankyrin repeat-containing domain protein [Colletotrichum scovillei]